MQTIYPYLLYDDAAAAIEFLSRAFGFSETFRAENDGRVAHARLRLGDGEVMLGQPPQRLNRDGDQTVLMYVYVDDVDAHCERARSAGAQIVDAPKDEEYGERVYHARDSEGHSWYFGRRIDG